MPVNKSDIPTYGPLGYEKWRVHNSGHSGESEWQVQLFSDSRIIGETSKYTFGPFILSLLSSPREIECTPVIAIEGKTQGIYGSSCNTSPPGKTDEDRYYGGWTQDELAALLSLLLGIRLKVETKSPYLPRHAEGTLIPLPSEVRFEEALFLDTYPSLPTQSAISLLRAAHLFKDALWICDSDPNSAWLMLVSAVEVAAEKMYVTADDPIKSLQERMPEWAEKLQAAGNDLLRYFASEWVPRLSAGKKFREFLCLHLPEPPKVRAFVPDTPLGTGLLEWKPSKLSHQFNKIYSFRSRALHGGRPFPYPMCWPPLWPHLSPVPYERMDQRSGMGSCYGMWYSKDIPMYLHTFVHIVRGALINWWKEQVGKMDARSQ
jgi:hypothetical protein